MNFYQISARAFNKKQIEDVLNNNDIKGDNEFSANCSIFWVD